MLRPIKVGIACFAIPVLTRLSTNHPWEGNLKAILLREDIMAKKQPKKKKKKIR
jgi:hypothetical protein